MNGHGVTPARARVGPSMQPRDNYLRVMEIGPRRCARRKMLHGQGYSSFRSTFGILAFWHRSPYAHMSIRSDIRGRIKM